MFALVAGGRGKLARAHISDIETGMVNDPPQPTSRQSWALLAILVAAFALRLVNLNAPLLDGMTIKQVYVAHRARQIAQPPFDLFRNTFDLLTDEGKPLNLVEEMPLYPGIVAVGYRLFGEHEFFGRLLSVLATLVAIWALYDLVRSELGTQVALLCAFFFSMTPLLIFYGRAFQPDVCMLAAMLLSACAYARYLRRPRWTLYLLTLVAGALAAMFKYFGLMVLVPLAFMTFRQYGWRRAGVVTLAGLAFGMCLPVAIWMANNFLNHHNPAQEGAYFIFQMPRLLLQKTLYFRFFDRFLFKECGPVLALLIATGIWAVKKFRVQSASLVGWTVTGLGYFILIGPKSATHHYYDLMLLPAASLWGAIGWAHLWKVGWGGKRWLGITTLIAMVVVQSPLVMHGEFTQERGLLLAAQELQSRTGAAERIIVASPCGIDVIHYARRQGWTWYGPMPADWRERIERYRQLGAVYMLVYLDQTLSEATRLEYREVSDHWPVVLHKSGPWGYNGQPVEYYILDLRNGAPVHS